MLKATPPFAMSFAAVCALEFSVNDRIKTYHGVLAGICASALTGAGFLTAADHLMFRRHRGESLWGALNSLYSVRPSSLWTGFTPMVGREAIFISSVMYLGPALGKLMNGGNSNNDSLLWNSLGRVITGVITTFIS